MPKFLESIDLTGNKLKNSFFERSHLENLSSHPTTELVAGRIYFNTTDDVAYVYDGSSWRGTAAPDVVNDILDGSESDVTSIKYAPYSTNQAGSSTPKFYTSANNPTGTSRLNISSYLYATRLYEGGTRVVNTARTLTLNSDTNVTITDSGSAQNLSSNRSWTLGWSGQLSVARGGTGQSSFTNGQLLIGNTTGNTLTKTTLTEGADISITNGSGSITIAHSNTSTQASSINSGRTYIQSIELNDNGHVTSISTAIETVTDTTYSDGGGIGLSETQFSVAGGDGLVQETSGLKLGTPSTLNNSTTNNVTSTSHTHEINGFALSSHNHSTADITSGTLPVGRGGTGATTFTAGRILFGNGTSAINTNTNLFWNNSESRLGVGTTTPDESIHTSGNIKTDGEINVQQKFVMGYNANTNSFDFNYVG